jgi:hypothetical protein
MLTPVILAIRRLGSGLKPAQAKEFMRLYLKNTLHKNKAGGVAQGEGPEFKP